MKKNINSDNEDLIRLLNGTSPNEILVIDNTEVVPELKQDASSYVVKYLKYNKSVDEICNRLLAIYSITRVDALKMIREAKKHLQEQYKNYVANVAEKNTQILQQIMDESLERGDRKMAVECIKELNKMAGLTNGNTYIQQNNQFNFNDVEIVFK